MNYIQLIEFVQQERIKRMKEIENDLVPFGFINGAGDPEKEDDEAVLEGDQLKGWTVERNWTPNFDF